VILCRGDAPVIVKIFEVSPMPVVKAVTVVPELTKELVGVVPRRIWL